MKIKNQILQKIDKIDEGLFELGIELDLKRFGFVKFSDDEEEETNEEIPENQLGNQSLRSKEEEEETNEEESYDTDDVQELTDNEIKKLI